jgi:hypothetical protein
VLAVCNALTWPCSPKTVDCKDSIFAIKAAISARIPLSLSSPPKWLSLASSARPGKDVSRTKRAATVIDPRKIVQLMRQDFLPLPFRKPLLPLLSRIFGAPVLAQLNSFLCMIGLQYLAHAKNRSIAIGRSTTKNGYRNGPFDEAEKQTSQNGIGGNESPGFQMRRSDLVKGRARSLPRSAS